MANEPSSEERIKALEEEVASLRAQVAQWESGHKRKESVGSLAMKVPAELEGSFHKAQEVVESYFSEMELAPSRATIEIAGQRYLLVRASALSLDFLQTMQRLYDERGPLESLLIGKQFLFDLAHVMGIEDARAFHHRTGMSEPLEKLSVGPVLFAFMGWSYVEMLPESRPVADENFLLHYKHTHSFEADSWMRAGKHAEVPICSMSAGYSSGWCEQSYGIPLTAVELTCRACGDDCCSFLMAPPDRIEAYLRNTPVQKGQSQLTYEIPTFFARKQIEEEMAAARQKAEESDLAKTQFLANMSHEIRTPLHAILGYVDLIQKEEELPPQLREYLDTIQESGVLLQQLLTDLLDFSKMEAQQLALHKEAYPLERLFRASEVLATGLIGERGLKFRVECDERLSGGVTLQTDPTRLQQIVFNLLSNAIKFTEQGEIVLGARLLKGNRLAFFVRDTGHGIPSLKRQAVFEMFSQLGTPSYRQGGVGLGLTIVDRLVKLLGGQIWLESSQGKGSTFTFTHPFEQAEEIADLLNEQETESHSVSLAVLVVDDNVINRRFTTLILEKEGHTVHQASNGREAIDFAKSLEGLALILMDVQMPVIDGLEATRAIREYERDSVSRPVPIIALTAHAMESDRQRCLDAGCDGYMTKPFTSQMLLDVLKQYARLEPSPTKDATGGDDEQGAQ